MTAIAPTITQAGLQAFAAASTSNTSVELTHVALGDGRYTPASTRTALENERQRVPIADGTANGRTASITVLADGDEAFWVREIGFYAGDTLVAVWSDPELEITFKSENAPLVLAQDLEFLGVPEELVTIQTSGVPLNLNVTDVLAAYGAAIIDANRRYLDLFNRHIELSNQLRDAGVI